MGKSHAAAPAAPPSPRTWPKPKEMFSNARSIIWSVLFILFFAIDCAELGLVSQQIHNYGGQNRFDWPGAEVGHAMGLLLFASIFSLLFILFHWAMGLRIFAIVFLMTGVFWGTGAGIVYQTPFGHGLRCNDGAASFPANYQPFYSQCARWKAIEGLAWALFALSVFGLFYAIADQFEFRTRRRAVYDIEQNANGASAEKANRTSEETAVSAH